MFKRPAVICDLDGTLCDTAHRQHFLEAKPKNWDAFFGGIQADPINAWCRDILRGLTAQNYTVLFVTGRMEKYRIPTLAWFDRQAGLSHGPLHMRDDNDFRPDYEVKAEIYKLRIEPWFDVKLVIDDRASVVAMWRKLGLTVLACADGNF